MKLWFLALLVMGALFYMSTRGEIDGADPSEFQLAVFAISFFGGFCFACALLVEGVIAVLNLLVKLHAEKDG